MKILILINRQKKPKKRDIRKDPDAKQLLNYQEQDPVKMRDTIGNSNTSDINTTVISNSTTTITITTTNPPGLPDLWDILCENVVMISSSKLVNPSKAKVLGDMKKTGRLNQSAVTAFSEKPSAVPTPTTQRGVVKTGKGNYPVGQTPRKTPGMASVTQGQQQIQQKAVMDEVREKLKTIAEEEGNVFEEVHSNNYNNTNTNTNTNTNNKTNRFIVD